MKKGLGIALMALGILFIGGLLYWYFAISAREVGDTPTVAIRASAPNLQIPPPTSAVPDIQIPSISPAPDEVADSPGLEDFCKAQSAQEVWYRLEPTIDDLTLQERISVYQKLEGRQVVVRQSLGAAGIVTITAANRDANAPFETSPDTINTERGFVDNPRLLEILPERFKTGLNSMDPVSITETMTWGTGDSVTLANDIATELAATWKPAEGSAATRVMCPLNSSCHCGN